MNWELSLYDDKLFVQSLNEVSSFPIGNFDYACLEKSGKLVWYESTTMNIVHRVVPESTVPTGCTKTLFFNLADQICIFNVNSIHMVQHYDLAGSVDRRIKITVLECVFRRPLDVREHQDAVLILTKGGVAVVLLVDPSDAKKFVNVFEKGKNHDQNFEMIYTSALRFAPTQSQ